MPVKEIILYVTVALSALFILGYTVHMFVGGLVNPETETLITVVVCAVGAAVIGFMAWDVARRRRGIRH